MMGSEITVDPRSDAIQRATFGDHATRVGALATKLAHVIGLRGAALTTVRTAALLHDVGKLCIPDAILYKPGPLTEAEWVMMRQHPQFARQLLTPITDAGMQPVLTSVHHHHERWDGTGYPDGLAGDAIPLAARIVALVDTWDALISDRPYRAAWSPSAAHTYIADQAGHQFDPLLVALFLALYAPERNDPCPYSGTQATLPLTLRHMQTQRQSGRMLIIRPDGGTAAMAFRVGTIMAAHAVPSMTTCAHVGQPAIAMASHWSPVRYWLLHERPGTAVTAAEEPHKIPGQPLPPSDLVARVLARLSAAAPDTPNKRRRHP